MSTLGIVIIIVAALIALALIAFFALRGKSTEKRRTRARELRDRSEIKRAQAQKERAGADEQEARARRETAEAEERARVADRRHAEAERQADRAKAIDPDRKRGGFLRRRKREPEHDEAAERR